MALFFFLDRDTQRKLIFAALLLSGAACGAGGNGAGGTECPPGEPLSGELAARFAAVQECTGIDGPAPLVHLAPTAPCPTSGLLRCIADEPAFPCGSDPLKLCGYGGLYRTECNVVVLPDLHTAAAEHEFVHALLEQATGDADGSHDSPLFATCG